MSELTQVKKGLSKGYKDRAGKAEQAMGRRAMKQGEALRKATGSKNPKDPMIKPKATKAKRITTPMRGAKHK